MEEKKKEVKEVKKEVKEESKKVQESIKVALTFADGSTWEQTAYLQEFKPNTAKGFQNFGYSVQSNFNNHKINIVIIDSLRQKSL